MAKLGDEPAYPFTPNQQMKLDDGTWDQNTDCGDPGMTKRELIAAMVMQKLSFVCTEVGIEKSAKHCVKVADALLAELAKEPDDE
ncbi:MAG: hypothetical protein IID41_00575 [Planctomycetes bacterium]|nr:hypothetical protein [Planctomycetota bacterium]